MVFDRFSGFLDSSEDPAKEVSHMMVGMAGMVLRFRSVFLFRIGKERSMLCMMFGIVLAVELA